MTSINWNQDGPSKGYHGKYRILGAGTNFGSSPKLGKLNPELGRRIVGMIADTAKPRVATNKKLKLTEIKPRGGEAAFLLLNNTHFYY